MRRCNGSFELLRRLIRRARVGAIGVAGELIESLGNRRRPRILACLEEPVLRAGGVGVGDVPTMGTSISGYLPRDKVAAVILRLDNLEQLSPSLCAHSILPRNH